MTHAVALFVVGALLAPLPGLGVFCFNIRKKRLTLTDMADAVRVFGETWSSWSPVQRLLRLSVPFAVMAAVIALFALADRLRGGHPSPPSLFTSAMLSGIGVGGLLSAPASKLVREHRRAAQHNRRQ